MIQYGSSSTFYHHTFTDMESSMIQFLYILILIIAGITDLFYKKIYNRFPFLIAILAILRIIHDPTLLQSSILGFFVLSIPMLFLTLRHGGLGGGDIKLTAACGLFLGADALLAGFLIAGLLALTIRTALRLFHKQNSERTFAFGPFLSAGFILAAFL